MYNRRFFASRLRFAALVSIAAMVTFNVLALTQQLGMMPAATTAYATPMVELA